jgi:hypothetical protein
MSQSGSAARAVLGLLAGMIMGAAAVAFFLLRPSGPQVATLAPTRARPGEAVTIKGTRFAAVAQSNVVLFGDHAGRVLSSNPGEIRAEVPELEVAPGSEIRLGVRVLAGDRASNPVDVEIYREQTGDATDQASQPAAPPSPGAAPTPAPVPVTATPAPKPDDAAAPRRRAAATPRPPATAPAEPPATTPPGAAVEGPGPGALPEPPAATRRAFVLERTTATSNKRVNLALAGFDPNGVDVKRAPDIAGRLEFEVSPARVKPGDSYNVKAYLVNDGGKPIRIKQMFVATTVNGALSAGTMPPRLRDVSPRKREVIGTFSDVWRENTATWAMDITVTSERGDVYKNQVTWK